MARTKNAKRARVEGESSAPARLIASFHYMARWLPSQRALEKLCGEVRVKANCSSQDRRFNLVLNALQTQHLVDFVQTRDEYYPHLVRAVYSTLNYVVPEPDEEGEVMSLIEFDLGKQHYRVTLQELAEQWSLVYHGAKFTGGIAADEEWGEYNRLVGLQSLQYENPQMDARAKIDDSTLRQMGRDPDAQQPQAQGQPQDQVQAQTEPPPPPPPPSPTMQDLMNELRSMRVYMEEQFADMRQRQDRQTEAINHQGEAFDYLCTNLGITNPRGIIPRPGP
ncbi:hypothetical protein HN51_027140 [Arachis hypogaea]